jgi:hypothetical protein
VLFAKYNQNVEVKVQEINRTCRTEREEEYTQGLEGLVGNIEGKRPL